VDAEKVAAGIAAFILGPHAKVDDYYYYRQWDDLDDDRIKDPDEIKVFRQERVAWTLWSKSTFACGRVKPEVLNLLISKDLLPISGNPASGTGQSFFVDSEGSDGQVPIVVLSSDPDAVLQALNDLGEEIATDKEFVNLTAFREAEKELDAELRTAEERSRLLDGSFADMRKSGLAKRANLNQVLATFGASSGEGETSGTLTINAGSPLANSLAKYEECVKAEAGDNVALKQCASEIERAYREEIERLLKNLQVPIPQNATLQEVIALAQNALKGGSKK